MDRGRKEILLRGKVCAYLTARLMGDPFYLWKVIHSSQQFEQRCHTFQIGEKVPSKVPHGSLGFFRGDGRESPPTQVV